MVKVVILLGAPGAGKGTQASRLATSSGLPHVSTGDLFRKHQSEGTELGRRAKQYMDAGRLVPDELVLDMLFERVAQPDCAEGYLLDGFPRTDGQARSLDERLGDDARPEVYELVVSDDTIVRRVSGRLVCSKCGSVQHAEFAPPREKGRCDACGGELVQRPDDRSEVVRERLRVYHEQTAPLVRFYEERGILRKVDGERAPDAVFADLARWISSNGLEASGGKA